MKRISSFGSYFIALDQEVSKNDFAMLIFRGVSSINILRKLIASGKSRLYRCIVPLSILEKVVSSPEPIFTIVAFGCFLINCLIVSSIFRVLYQFSNYFIAIFT